MMHPGIHRDDPFSPIDDCFAHAMLKLSGETNPTVARVLRLVSAAARHGDVCIHLKDEATRLHLSTPDMTLSAPADLIAALKKTPVIGDGLSNTPLVMDESGRIYLHRFWHTQKRLVDAIVDKSTAADIQPLPNDPEARAVYMARQSRFLVITGGPGAGKTTLASTVLASLIKDNPDTRIAACAPTGKAAVRLRESLDHSRVSPLLMERFSAQVLARLPRHVSTIHKLLSPRARSGQFRYSGERTLPVDVLLVDEASMVDLQLMTALFDAVPMGAKVILLGDPYQLASIEPGRVLGDICFNASPQKPVKNEAVARRVVTLAGSHRFGEQSGIGKLASAVNAGDSQAALQTVLDNRSADIEFVDVKEPNAKSRLTELITALFADVARAAAPDEKLRHIESARILSGVNNGPFGVHALNRMAEMQLESLGLIRIDGDLYDSKPILIPQNDYRVSLFNGDTGVTVKNGGRLMACFRGEDGHIRQLSVSALRRHLPAYATTIHKSQGSEFDHVVLVLPDISPVLSRELLYTAVTRARKKLTVFSTPAVIAHCVASPTKRAFSLGYHLWGVEEDALQ